MAPYVVMEISYFALIGYLGKLTYKYVNQYNGYRDKIIKAHASFLLIFLVLKAINALTCILRYQGALNGYNWIKFSYVALVNDFALLFLIIGCSFNLLKWLLILNRVFFYSGNRT